MERQEKKLIGDIKKMAKSGQMEAVKIMAKDLVRTRNFVKKFILMRANIQAVSLKIQTLRSQSAMANALKGIKLLIYLLCIGKPSRRESLANLTNLAQIVKYKLIFSNKRLYILLHKHGIEEHT